MIYAVNWKIVVKRLIFVVNVKLPLNFKEKFNAKEDNYK